MVYNLIYSAKIFNLLLINKPLCNYKKVVFIVTYNITKY